MYSIKVTIVAGAVRIDGQRLQQGTTLQIFKKWKFQQFFQAKTTYMKTNSLLGSGI